MPNKLLKKVMGDLSSLPEPELRKLVQDQMDEADLVEGVLDSLPEGHIIFSPQQRTVRINSAAYHL